MACLQEQEIPFPPVVSREYIKKKEEEKKEEKEIKEWLKERRKGVGASDSPLILPEISGTSWGGPLTVYEAKVNEKPRKKETTSDFTFWGNLFEKNIIQAFRIWLKETEKREVVVESNGRKIHRLGILQATPDARITDAEYVEIKLVHHTKASEWGNTEQNSMPVPMQYWIQCQHQLYVTKTNKIYLVALIGGFDLRVYLIERNNDFLENILVPRVNAFWQNYVEKRIPPEATHLDEEVLKRNYPKKTDDEFISFSKEEENNCERMLQLTENIKELTAQKKEFELRLKQRIGGNKGGIGEGYTVKWDSYPLQKFDLQKFKKENPKVYDKYLLETDIRRFYCKKNKI